MLRVFTVSMILVCALTGPHESGADEYHDPSDVTQLVTSASPIIEYK